MAVVREDVVQIGFDVDTSELKRLQDTIEEMKKLLTSGFGDDAFDEMTKEGKEAAKSVEGVKDAVNGVKSDKLDQAAKELGKVESEGGDARKELERIGKVGFDKTISGLKSITTTLGKVGLAAGKLLMKGLFAGAAGVGAMVSQAVSSYANYEQLTGGVETLFGGADSLDEYTKSISKSTESIKEFQRANGLAVDGIIGPKTTAALQESFEKIGDAPQLVMDNANKAWKTVGLSANDYMETVTSFAGSLLQSVGGDTTKAANMADLALVDMADNANKMGTSMESIRYAYMGFSKQNYTMLDNLNKMGALAA